MLNVKDVAGYQAMDKYVDNSLIKAMGMIASGQGVYPAGALLSVQNGIFVNVDPADSVLKSTFAVALDSFDARSEAASIIVSGRGIFSLDFVFIPRHDAFTGDGTTTTFTLSYRPKRDTVTVYVNGAKKLEDMDYTVDYFNRTITFNVAPASGDTIDVYYGDGLREFTFNTQTFNVGEAIQRDSLALYQDGSKVDESEYTVDYDNGIITMNETPTSEITVYYVTPAFEAVRADAMWQEIFIVNPYK